MLKLTNIDMDIFHMILILQNAVYGCPISVINLPSVGINAPNYLKIC